MNHGPVVLGINRTQDASICLMHGSQLQWAIQKERLTRRRHHAGKPGDFTRHYLPRLPGLERPIDVLVECSSAGAARLHHDHADPEPSLLLSPGCRRLHLSHHLAHLYSVFHPSPFQEAAVMVIDVHGSPAGEFTEHWRGAAGAPAHWREVASFYRASRSRVECIGKQLWDCDAARPAGLGMFYSMLAQALFPGDGNEDKVMGLAPHGDARALGLPPLAVDGNRVTLPPAWRQVLGERARFHYGAPGVRFSDCANLAAVGQRAFEEALLALARWLHAETGLDDLCFAGGTGLNCCANDRLLRETPFRHVFIPPAPGGAGTALGCALYGLAELADTACDYRWTHDYLGPEPDPAGIAHAVAQASDLVVERFPGRDALCQRMLDLLCARKVVALYQGRSEFGPRALGHRSILGDPRRSCVRDWINAHIKQREWFRPLAPVVLAERAADYFDLPGAAPFMQFASPVRPAMAGRLGATTHVGGTARLQTVAAHDDPLLRALLEGFDCRTGIPVLLNTSFNGRDEPIVESPAEAIAAFRRMPLHALAMPPFLLRKHIEPETPE